MTQTSQRVQARVDGEVFDPEQLAIFFKFSTRKVKRLLKKKELPGRKIGNHWRTTKAELDKFLSAT